MSYSVTSASDSSPVMSSVGQDNLHRTRRRTYLARMPVTVSNPRRTKQQPPQDIIDEFWANFTTKTPGKGLLHLRHAGSLVVLPG